MPFAARSADRARPEKCLGRDGQAAIGEAAGRPLRFARVAKQLAFQRIEAVGGGEETKTVRIAHDDSRGFRSNFDDVGVRHFLERLLFPSARQ